MSIDFARLEAAARERLSVRLFTVLAWDDAASILHRVYSSHPAQYPPGGEKSFSREAPWVRRVILGQQPYLGRDRTAVAAVFDDFELIAALGCGAVINVPVVDSGQTLGVLNLLDAEGAYVDESVGRALPLAPLAVQPLRQWHSVRQTEQPEQRAR